MLDCYVSVADGSYQNAILLPVSFIRRPLVICSGRNKKKKKRSEASKTANKEGVPTPLQFSIIHFSNKHIILLELHSSDLDLSTVWRFSLFTNYN